ncbi:tetraspanin tsp3 [Ophiostoma piceae UAMH 11346]|uniref:Tetraspanin tsp3 n=1 Tax=Ophiostoma piceae (strain UAMH 11346) TaxID=1262450 RepID=S3CS72_OPHP1|nr:tetraspanin tsp3 [Ophiostoma piceae UAMH 11346]
MALWIMLYFLLMFALVGVAIYEHHTASVLSLPLSPALTALAIVLPILGLANSLSLPNAFPSSTISRHRDRDAIYTRLFQAAQLLQLILSVVLSTSFFTDAVPSAVRDCLLSTTWQRLFIGKEKDAIRRIQDTFNCCGFNSVRDRAWPFAEDINRGGGVACAERFGREVPCAGPWAATLQRSAGIDGGTATMVAVFQVVLFLLWQWFSNRHSQRGEGGWPRQLLAQFTGMAVESDEPGARRPLLGSGNGHIEEEEEADTGSDYVVDEEQGRLNEHTEHRTQATTRSGSYGTTGPRVEPSYQPGQSEPNAWGEDA